MRLLDWVDVTGVDLEVLYSAAKGNWRTYVKKCDFFKDGIQLETLRCEGKTPNEALVVLADVISCSTAVFQVYDKTGNNPNEFKIRVPYLSYQEIPC